MSTTCPSLLRNFCPEQDWNPRPVDRKSNALSVAPPRHLIAYLRTKFDHSSFSRFRDTVGAHQNLNGSRDLTTPLSGMVCHSFAASCERAHWQILTKGPKVGRAKLGRDTEGAENRDAEDVHSNMATRVFGILRSIAPCSSPKCAS